MSRRSWLIAGQSLLGVILLAAWVYLVDARAVAATLLQADWRYVVLAAAIAMASTYLRAVRWRRVLAPIKRLPLLEVWLIGLASSLINFVVPIRSGELARGVFLKQRHSIGMSRSLPTVAVDRSLDMVAVVVVGVIGVATGLSLGQSLTLALTLGAALFVAFAGFVFVTVRWHEQLLSMLENVFPTCLGEALRTRLLGILQGLLGGFAAVGRRPRALFPLTLLAFAAALLDGIGILLIFHGVGYNIAPLTAITGYAIFALTFLIPGAPGYVGSFEALGSLVFVGALAIPEAEAGSAILIFHALNAALLGVAGGLAFWILGVRPAQVLRSALERSPVVGPDAGEAL